MVGRILALVRLLFGVGGRIADEAESYRRTSEELRSGASEALKKASELRAGQALSLERAEELRRDVDDFEDEIDKISARVDLLKWGRRND